MVYGSGSSDKHTGALTHWPAHVLFWISSICTVSLDLWSKCAVFRSVLPGRSKPVLGGFVELRRSLNDGAVFGSFTGYVGVFIVASLFALGFVFYLFARSGRRQRGLHLALALILAGAIGNLYDRAFIKADVVRFKTPSGAARRFIGTIVGEKEDPVLRIGDWPGGENVRSFARSEVALSRQGVVRDFIKFTPTFPIRIPYLGGRDMWPWVFNVADAALVVGVAVLLLHGMFDRKRLPRDP